MFGIDGEDINATMTYTIVTNKEKKVSEEILQLLFKQIKANKTLFVYNSNYKISNISLIDTGINITLCSNEDTIESEDTKGVFINSIISDLYKNFSNTIYNLLVDYLNVIKEKVNNKKKLTDNDKKLIKFFKDGYKIIYEDSKSFKIRISSQLNSAIYDIDDILDDEDFDLWIGDD